MNKEIYFDNAATTHLHPKVLEHLIELYRSGVANSASIHHAGVKASMLLERARNTIAHKLGVSPEEIYFLSGATEANNLALKGACSHLLAGDEVIISSIEHSSVQQVADELKRNGIIVKTARVHETGLVDLSYLESLVNSKTKLISIVHGNNEVGVLQPLSEIGKLCSRNKILFHADGAQSFAKTQLDLSAEHVDIYSLSGHKIHAPKGIGALYVRSGVKLHPQLLGGKQEAGLRAGTVAVELASALGVATQLYTKEELNRVKQMKHKLVAALKTIDAKVSINGSLDNSLPTILNFSILGFSGKELLRELDKKNIRVSVGSACHSGQKAPSHVLMAMGMSEERAFEAIRLGIGLMTTDEEIEEFLGQLRLILKDQR